MELVTTVPECPMCGHAMLPPFKVVFCDCQYEISGIKADGEQSAPHRRSVVSGYDTFLHSSGATVPMIALFVKAESLICNARPGSSRANPVIIKD
jgi:hypothetical protein